MKLYAPLLLAVTLHAGTLSFSCITNNSGQCDALAPQLSATYTDAGHWEVINAGPLESSITGVYIMDPSGILTGIANLAGSPGVSFSSGGTPQNLPAGNTAGFTATQWATADPPPSPDGIHGGQSLTFDTGLSGSLSNALAGGLSVGLHVQSYAEGFSESLVTGGVDTFRVTPEPSTVGLIGTGVMLLALGGVFHVQKRDRSNDSR